MTKNTAHCEKRFPLENVTYLFVNETEGRQITGQTAPEAVVDGACYADGAKRVYQKAFPVKAVDTTGAGDTFTGYFLGAITRGETEETALREACAAAAVSVTNHGAADGIPSMQTVREFLKTSGEC